jgi:ADP-ribose pyrophosphatase
VEFRAALTLKGLARFLLRHTYQLRFHIKALDLCAVKADDSASAMDIHWPRILQTKRKSESPWLEIISRDVQLTPDAPIETYYAIGQPDYLVALAVTPDSRILLVRQFRPTIERFSLELPAGMIDPGEAPDSAIARELLEETGYPAETVQLIGTSATCASRISNSTYSFFIRTGIRSANFIEEPGVSVSSATPAELRSLMLSGDFSEQCHLGVIALAYAKGLVNL